MAGLLLAALLQGKEADRVEQPPSSLPRGKLSASQPTHPNIHPPWTSFSKQQQVGLRGSNSSFHSCKREYQRCPLKNDSPAYLVVWNMKSAVGRNALWDMGGICHRISELCLHGTSHFCLSFECCSLLNKNLFLQSVEQWCLSSVWMDVPWTNVFLPFCWCTHSLPCQAN